MEGIKIWVETQNPSEKDKAKLGVGPEHLHYMVRDLPQAMFTLDVGHVLPRTLRLCWAQSVSALLMFFMTTMVWKTPIFPQVTDPLIGAVFLATIEKRAVNAFSFWRR